MSSTIVFFKFECSSKGRSLSVVSANKSQTSGRNNGRSPIGTIAVSFREFMCFVL